METTFTIVTDTTRILGELDKLHELHPEVYPDQIYEPFIKLVKKYKQVVLSDSYDLDETNKLFERLVKAGFPILKRTEYNLILTHENIIYVLDACEYNKLELEAEDLTLRISSMEPTIPSDFINGFNYPLRSYAMVTKDEINSQRLLEYAQGTFNFDTAIKTFNALQEQGRAVIIISYFEAIDTIREYLKKYNVASANLDMDRLVIASHNIDLIYLYIILSQKYRTMNSIRYKY